MYLLMLWILLGTIGYFQMRQWFTQRHVNRLSEEKEHRSIWIKGLRVFSIVLLGPIFLFSAVLIKKIL